MTGRWQDWMILVYGLWLLLSPFFSDYGTTYSAAAWNAYIAGATLLTMARLALLNEKLWEESVNVAVGTWLYFSPFVVGFYGNNAATWTQMSLGVLVFWTAIWAIGRSDEPPVEPISMHSDNDRPYRKEF